MPRDGEKEAEQSRLWGPCDSELILSVWGSAWRDVGNCPTTRKQVKSLHRWLVDPTMESAGASEGSGGRAPPTILRAHQELMPPVVGLGVSQDPVAGLFFFFFYVLWALQMVCCHQGLNNCGCLKSIGKWPLWVVLTLGPSPSGQDGMVWFSSPNSQEPA
jgi:hypothetical protein